MNAPGLPASLSPPLIFCPISSRQHPVTFIKSCPEWWMVSQQQRIWDLAQNSSMISMGRGESFLYCPVQDCRSFLISIFTDTQVEVYTVVSSIPNFPSVFHFPLKQIRMGVSCVEPNLMDASFLLVSIHNFL